VRDEPKSQAFCAFAYVGPALPCWHSNNPQCISLSDDEHVYSFKSKVLPRNPEVEFENHLEFALVNGERYGCWSDHTLIGDKRATAMVHGAIFNHRTQVLMDSGATTSIMSLDLARRLKFKLRYGYKLRVTGMGDVPTYVTAQARIKLTLRVRVVYVMDIWVGNIGGGVDCLLGMDFMVAAGVRLCAREGVVRLPDEESLLLVGGPEVDHMGLKVDISLNEGVDLAPGDSVIVPVRSRRADSSQVQIWAGRGDQWVTQLLYGPGRRPKAVKVVNVSERIASLHHHTVVACLIERNYLPTGGRFARPKSRKYKEWEQLIFEAEPSPEFLKREELEARQAELAAPPADPRPTYWWPKKLLLKKKCPAADPSMSKVVEPSETPAEAYLVHTQTPPGTPSC